MCGTPGAVPWRMWRGRRSLNAPWGLAWAPEGFSRFSGDLLHRRFEQRAGPRLSSRRSPGGFLHRGVEYTARRATSSRSNRLWAITFGDDGAPGPGASLYFTPSAGRRGHGLFGRIDALDDSMGGLSRRPDRDPAASSLSYRRLPAGSNVDHSRCRGICTASNPVVPCRRLQMCPPAGCRACHALDGIGPLRGGGLTAVGEEGRGPGLYQGGAGRLHCS